ncbi:MAG: DUF2933 domain-containing protein [Bosea sp.]|jgi:hypothetical protein|nr:DUF2933 domain-containing protein [Bosea sp. (in: a-proteobacteria)]
MTLDTLVPRTKSGKIIAVVLAIGIILAVADHWMHLFGFLPLLIILACLLMHLFMHHGHGGHAHKVAKDNHDV